MPLERYLAKSRIIEIQSDDLNGALEELLKEIEKDEEEKRKKKKKRKPQKRKKMA